MADDANGNSLVAMDTRQPGEVPMGDAAYYSSGVGNSSPGYGFEAPYTGPLNIGATNHDPVAASMSPAGHANVAAFEHAAMIAAGAFAGNHAPSSWPRAHGHFAMENEDPAMGDQFGSNPWRGLEIGASPSGRGVGQAFEQDPFRPGRKAIEDVAKERQNTNPDGLPMLHWQYDLVPANGGQSRLYGVATQAEWDVWRDTVDLNTIFAEDGYSAVGANQLPIVWTPIYETNEMFFKHAEGTPFTLVGKQMFDTERFTFGPREDLGGPFDPVD
jgi:hypothetical protein